MFERVAQHQSRIIIYRATGTNQPGAATVYVNDRYHASLIPGGYAQVCLPPGGAELGVRMVAVGRNPKDNLDSTTAINPKGGETSFLSVREQAGMLAVLQPVPAAQAMQELQGTRQQAHTISRVPNAEKCIDAGPAAPQVASQPIHQAAASVASQPIHQAAASVALQQINLAADSLFAFGKSDLKSMSTAGRTSLDNLISQIKTPYLSIERVHIVGHADPLGSEVINDRLSTDRAKTVRDYLLVNGLQVSRIESEGRGSREPVVRHCGSVATAQAIACNQPNRRVAIELSGVRR
ncbi:OmpA family protein [Limnohabitans sp. Bal53]|uniref:OmpA family protein n=1 Tax=Limnohabitans sp. Bal53 TaxID=1977910 RepID=UPI001304ECA0|nr:OmpA family protein [Limnohabitans sp. Bal53]